MDFRTLSMAYKYIKPRLQQAGTERDAIKMLLAGGLLRGILHSIPLSKRIRMVRSRVFASLPGRRIILAPEFNEARRRLHLNRSEYKSVLEHEMQHLRDWPLTFTSTVIAPTAASIGGTILAHRRFNVDPLRAAEVSLPLSHYLVTNPLIAIAERRADIAAAKKYGVHYLNALKKVYRYSGHKSNPLENIPIIDPHTSLENRMRRVRSHMKLPIIPPGLAIGAVGGAALGTYLGRRNRRKKRR